MLYLGIPVMDQHEMTQECVKQLAETVAEKSQVMVLIFDNGSEKPYTPEEFYDSGIKVVTYWNNKNEGYYYPLKQLAEWNGASITKADLLGLMHNDVLIYEDGWDARIRSSFLRDSNLASIGFCGSNEVDDRGGRGGGTMCNFRGDRGQKQESVGRRIFDLHPALIYDSLFMVFRQHAVPYLQIDEAIAPCHFYDKIWPLRLIENGFRCALLGIEIDHLGGITSVGNARYEESAADWCKSQGIDTNGNPGLAVYLEAERRFLTEFREEKHMIPASMSEWTMRPWQKVGTRWYQS